MDKASWFLPAARKQGDRWPAAQEQGFPQTSLAGWDTREGASGPRLSVLQGPRPGRVQRGSNLGPEAASSSPADPPGPDGQGRSPLCPQRLGAEAVPKGSVGVTSKRNQLHALPVGGLLRSEDTRPKSCVAQEQGVLCPRWAGGVPLHTASTVPAATSPGAPFWERTGYSGGGPAPPPARAGARTKPLLSAQTGARGRLPPVGAGAAPRPPAPYLLMDLLRGLGVTEGHRGHVLEDGHLHGAVPAV